MDMSTSYTIKAKVTGQDSITGLNKGLGKLKTTTNNNVTAMNKLRGAANGAIGALKNLAPAIGIAAMGKFVSDTLTAGDRLEKFAQSTGVAVPLLDKMRKASELAGTDFKTLVKTFPMLANNINRASQGVGVASEAFADLGIKVVDSNGRLRASDEVLLDIADEFAKMKDGVDKASFAYDIFGGKTGEQLIPLLNSGRDAIENMSTSMTEHGVKRMAAFNDSVTNLKHTFGDLFVTLTEALLPLFEKFVGVVTKLVQKFVGLPKPVQAIIGSLSIVVPLVVTLVPLLGAMVVSIKAIAAVKFGAMFAAAIPAITGLMPVLAPFLIGGAVLAGLIALGKLIGTVVGHIWAAKDQIGEAVGGIAQSIFDFFSPITNFIGGIFNGAIDMARQAFNRLPNIVQQAIKAATAPIRGFIRFLQRALSLLRRVNKAKSKKGSSTSSSTSSTSTSTSTSKSSSSGRPSLPYTSGYKESNLSAGNVGGGYKGFTPSFPMPMSSSPKTTRIPSGNKSNLNVTKLPSGGYSISGSGSNRKPPNVNIKTGNVTSIAGTNYVTTKDLQNAVQSGVAQTMNYIQAGGVKHYL